MHGLKKMVSISCAAALIVSLAAASLAEDEGQKTANELGTTVQEVTPEPTAEPTTVPTPEPTPAQTEVPTEAPTAVPTLESMNVPAEDHTAESAEEPTDEPAAEPTHAAEETPEPDMTATITLLPPDAITPEAAVSTAPIAGTPEEETAAEASKEMGQASAPTAGNEEESVSDPEQEDEAAEPDARLVLDQPYTKSITGEKSGYLLCVDLDWGMDAVLSTEGLPVRIVLTRENSDREIEILPAQEDQRYLPIREEIRMDADPYFLRVESMEKNAKGEFTILLQRKVIEEEITLEEEPIESDPAEEAAPDTDPDASDEEEEEISIVIETRYEEKDADQLGVEEDNPEDSEARDENADMNQSGGNANKSGNAKSGEKDADGDQTGENEEAPENTELMDENADAEQPEEGENIPEPSETGEEAAENEPSEIETIDESQENGEESAPEEESNTEPDEASGEDLEGESETEPVEALEPSVSIVADFGNAERYYAGMPVKLSAQITGADPEDYRYQWQYSPDGGETIIDIPDAVDSEYEYILDETNAGYSWRVSVWQNQESQENQENEESQNNENAQDNED